MKGIVAYYSAAGSTRNIARAIHRGMKDLMEECDIAPINKIARFSIEELEKD